jgi:glycosyltransferase involved in cell wall biosynthesis
MGGMIGRAIDSALSANAAQILIIDDCSHDYTRETVAHFTKQHHHIEYIELPFHSGVVYARNLGVHRAAMDLIVPLDADDQLLPDGIKYLYEGYQEDKWIYGNWIEKGETIIAPPPGMVTRKNVCQATMLFHKQSWISAGGYDADFEIGGEDWAFQRALIQTYTEPVKVDHPIYIRDITVNMRTDLARDRITFINQLISLKYDWD